MIHLTILFFLYPNQRQQRHLSIAGGPGQALFLFWDGRFAFKVSGA
jgi:hypothetical protein